MIVRVEGSRLSVLQALILLKLAKRPTRSSELLNELASRGLRSRSSFYTAVYELVERGLVEKSGGRTPTLSLTPKGESLIKELREKAFAEIKPVLSLVNDLIRLTAAESVIASLADKLEDPDELESYREFLLRELEKVEKRMSSWRKIEVS